MERPPMYFRDLKTQYETLKPEIDAALAGVLESASFIGGNPVFELEQALAEHIGVKHCITCGNGTDAITLGLMAMNVGGNDAVFVPDFTFFATVEAPAALGAHIVFVDVDPHTYNMDPVSLEKAVKRMTSEGVYTPKAVISVDLFGQAPDYYEIKSVCRENNLLLLEDSAQGLGGGVDITGNKDYKMNGSFGDIATTSFFPAKPIGCYGDGGAVFTDNDEWAAIIRSLCVHGKGENKYDNIRLGMNSRLDSIQAAILRVKLAAFKGESSVRKKIPYGSELLAVNTLSDIYDKEIKYYKKKGIEIPVIKKDNLSAWASYNVLLTKGTDRNLIQEKLAEKGIPTQVYYPTPLHRLDAFKKLSSGAPDIKPETEIAEETCKNSIALSERILALPIHPYLSEKEIKYVARCLGEML